MSMIRPAEEADVPVLLELIRDLAVYEKEPDAVKTTTDQLRDALFSAQPSVFAHVAEDDGGVQGFALWFRNFSTWEGVHGIYLEDLYVRPEARGRGYGKSLLQTLASHAVESGYARVEWAVLNWNSPSIDFYRSLGARPQEEWSTFRMTGDALSAFGAVDRVSL